MASTKVILALVCVTALVMGTKGEASRLEEMMEAMRSDIVQLQVDAKNKDEENLELKSEISGLKSEIKGLKMELQSSDSATVFDCYLTENWSTNGVIQFNGCDGKLINKEKIEFCLCMKQIRQKSLKKSLKYSQFSILPNCVVRHPKIVCLSSSHAYSITEFTSQSIELSPFLAVDLTTADPWKGALLM